MFTALYLHVCLSSKLSERFVLWMSGNILAYLVWLEAFMASSIESLIEAESSLSTIIPRK